MKKKILAVLIAGALSISMIGCTESEVNASNEDYKSMFTIVETGWDWKVVYHTETKVMYVVSAGSYNGGTFTVMVDADGNPLLWQE